MRMIVKGRAELERALGFAQGGDIIDILEDGGVPLVTDRSPGLALRRPVKKRTPRPRTIELPPVARRMLTPTPETRRGRPPKVWFCTGCSTNVAGRLCGGCGAPRP